MEVDKLNLIKDFCFREQLSLSTFCAITKYHSLGNLQKIQVHLAHDSGRWEDQKRTADICLLCIW
jgi:hypothetical protein